MPLLVARGRLSNGVARYRILLAIIKIATDRATAWIRGAAARVPVGLNSAQLRFIHGNFV
jgi:hypothetical protein